MREFVKLKESFQFSFLSGLLKQQTGTTRPKRLELQWSPKQNLGVGGVRGCYRAGLFVDLKEVLAHCSAKLTTQEETAILGSCCIQ